MRAAATALAVLLPLVAAPALAYTPGSGSVFTEDFNGALDADWEVGNNVAQSPWTQVADGGDQSFYADGRGLFPSSPSLHWARHFVTPVTATSFSVAFELRAELGTGYRFDLDVTQRAPVPKTYRLRVDGNGRLSLWRTEAGTFVQQASTASSPIPVNQKRWVRFAIEPGAGHPVVRVRVWSGSATTEPGGWTLEFTDANDTLSRVHRFELWADGPRGIETWIDDLDAYGDKGNGIASSVQTIWITEWSHLDIGFTEPVDEIETFAKTHLDQVLANVAADSTYRWTIEESWWLDRWWERSTEAQRDEMLARLTEGRIRLAAGYASLHTTTAGHEELIRNVYWARRFGRTHGVPVRFWITDDVPGSTWAVPEILARSGIEYYIAGMNTPFGGAIDHPNHGEQPFWWVGPDGSRVLSWLTFDSYAEGFDYGFSFFDNLPDLYRKLGRKLPDREEAGYPYPDLMVMRAFDNHYQGFKVRDLVNQWNATYATPKFKLATPDAFLDHMLATYGPDAFPSYRGDFGAAWSNSHANAQHTESWVRQAHREGRAAETLLAAGSVLDGQPVPRTEIELLYRRQLEVDEHSGAGSWPGYFTPEEMTRNNTIHLDFAREARDTAGTLLAEGLDRALARVPAQGDAVIVTNTLVAPRSAFARVTLPAALFATTFQVVDRATGLEVPYQRFNASSEILFRADDLPAAGYKVFDLVPGVPSAVPGGVLQVTATTLENDAYRVTIATTDGSVTSLVEKATGRELVDTASAYRFNRLASNVKSEADASQAPRAEAAGTVTVTIDAAGPLVAALRVTRTGTPHAETVYRLYRGEDRFEIENVLDRSRMPFVPHATAWRAYFVTLPFDIHTFQMRSETTTAFLDPFNDGFARSSLFDWHNAEHTLALWDDGGGVLYACDTVDATHIETLSTLASGAWSRGHALLLPRMHDKADEYEYEGGTIGPFTAEPGTPDRLTYVHSIRATPAGFDAAAASRFGFAALNPARARLVSARDGDLPGDAASFFRIDAPNVLAYTVKNADEGSALVARLQELTGAPTTARLASDVFTLANPELIAHDESGGAPLALDGGTIPVTLGPFETLTIRFGASLAAPPPFLTATRGAAAIHLEWTGGRAPYTLRRALNPQFTDGVVTLLDGTTATSFDDPVLDDGVTYFYYVTSTP